MPLGRAPGDHFAERAAEAAFPIFPRHPVHRGAFPIRRPGNGKPTRARFRSITEAEKPTNPVQRSLIPRGGAWTRGLGLDGRHPLRLPLFLYFFFFSLFFFRRLVSVSTEQTLLSLSFLFCVFVVSLSPGHFPFQAEFISPRSLFFSLCRIGTRWETEEQSATTAPLVHPAKAPSCFRRIAEQLPNS